jgi:sugar lactone lactonase YvrE
VAGSAPWLPNEGVLREQARDRHLLSALLMCLVSDNAPVVAQSGGNYTVDANWVRLPAGTTWNGNTSWITADGKGQVVVLVRTAPYFRVLTRDGALVKSFGDDGLFQSAHSVTIYSQGSPWVTDSAAQVQRRWPPANDARQEGSRRRQPSQDLFNQPNHVTVAPNGDVYVSDGYVNARVVQFSKDVQFVRIIGGVKGSQPGQLQLPHGIAMDSRGRLLVNDSDNQWLSIFDKDGKFVEAWPIPPAAGSPSLLTIPFTSAM